MKWALTFIAIGWAVYSANAFLFLARTFSEPAKRGVAELFASAQGYAIVFGPVVIALFFLIGGWPERKMEISGEHASDKEP